MSEEHITTVNGKKYDLRNFEHLHPGGSDLIKLAYGNDVTELIYSYHKNPEKVLTMLKRFEVDTSHHTHAVDIDTLFFRTLKNKVNRYFRFTKKNRRAGLLLRSTLLIFITLLTYVLSLYGYIFFALIFGVCLAWLGLCIHHDANHGSYSRFSKVNHYMGLFGDLIGSSSLIWRYQHCVGHHVHCNNLERDPDTRVGIPWFRLHPSQPYYSYMKYQQYYVFALYALMGIVTPFWSMYEFITRQHDSVKLKVVRKRDVIEFWAMKLIYFSYIFIIPFHVLGIAMLWKFYLPSQLMGSLYLATLFALNHNNQKIEATLKNQHEIKDWAMLQIMNSANWCSQSKFWNIISGGLNCQIEHHLFPSISHRHYPVLHRIVKKTCEKFQVPYHDYTFKELLLDHFLFLKRLGASR